MPRKRPSRARMAGYVVAGCAALLALLQLWRALPPRGQGEHRERASNGPRAASAGLPGPDQDAPPFGPHSSSLFVDPSLSLKLAVLAAATLVSEDLACVSAGLLVAQGQLSFLAAAGACVLGIYAGDLLLFLTGRWLGRPILHWSPVRGFISESAVNRASKWLTERGAAVVLLSRFTPGLRLPTYFAAGMLNTSIGRFSGLLMAANLVWTPVLVGLSAVVGGEVLRYTQAGGMAALWTVPLVLGLIAAGRHALPRLNRSANQWTRVRLWWRRLGWEFWPAWLAYVPVVTYIVALGIRHRCLTLFTAANPGIPCGGGLAGESKSAILRGLSNGGAPVARYARIRGDLSPRVRQFGVLSFLRAHGLRPPFVLKPDVGERGRGVKIVRSFRELMDYLEGSEGDIIVQEYVPGWEFGVFYYRFPGRSRGKIFSVTHKAFPSIVGDGKRTVEDLIRRDSRASVRAEAYLRTAGRDPGDVLARGERLPLIEIGSHCRGAIFLDGSHVITPELEREFDRISANFAGFYFGRFDVRAPSISEFRQGRGFKILELNGVSAEATHIYDPAIGMVEAYRTLFEQWRLAFEIGAANCAEGHQPLSLRELAKLVRAHAAGKPGIPACEPKGRQQRPATASAA